MMRISRVRINATSPRGCDAFTFVEVMMALAVACLVVTITSAALLNVLRMDISGSDKTAASLALRSTLCHHLLPETDVESDPLQHGFIIESAVADDPAWTIYTLTPSNDFGSLTLRLALRN